MITTIRKQLKSTMAKWIMWFFLITFGMLFLLPDRMGRMQNIPWIARINGQEIDAKVFGQATAKQQYTMRMLEQQYGQYAQMFMQMLGMDRDPQKNALNEIIREEIINQVAEKIPLYIDRKYLDQQFNNIEFIKKSGLYSILPLGFFNEQGLDELALREYLTRINMSAVEFEALAEKAIARYITLELASLASYTPSYMMKDMLDEKLGKRSYALLKFSLATLHDEEKKKGVSADELQAFFDLHNKKNKRYWLAEQRAGTLWAFDPASYGITISPQEVETYYNAQKLKKYVLQPSQVQVRHILFTVSEKQPKDALLNHAQEIRDALIKNPADFEKIARAESQDESSAKNGGLLPFFAKGERDAVFERKAFTLKQEGDISEIFETPQGFELVQLVAKKPIQYKPLKEVAHEIEQTLLNQQFAKDFSKDLKAVIDTTGLDEKKLQNFIAEKKHTKKLIPLTEKDDTKGKAILFRLKSGQADFYVEGNVGYIVQVTEIKPKSAPELSTVKDVVEQDMLLERSKEALAKRIEAAKSALKGKNFQDVAKEFHATLDKTDMLHKEDKDAIAKLKAQQMPIEKMLQLGKKGAIGASIEDDKGYLFTVIEAEGADHVTDEIERLRAEVEAYFLRANLFTEGFVASLFENATIETNNSLLHLNETNAI